MVAIRSGTSPRSRLTNSSTPTPLPRPEQAAMSCGGEPGKRPEAVYGDIRIWSHVDAARWRADGRAASKCKRSRPASAGRAGHSQEKMKETNMNRRKGSRYLSGGGFWAGLIGRGCDRRTIGKDQAEPTRWRLDAGLRRRTERHHPESPQRRLDCVRTQRSVFVCAAELQRAEIRI